MSIPSQVVRLFKLAAGQLFAVVLVSALFVGALDAQATKLTATANIKLEPTLVDGKPALTGKYEITCNKQDGDTIYGFGDMKLFYAITLDGTNDKEVRGLSGLYSGSGGFAQREGPLEVTGPLGGSMVKAKFSGVYCHRDQQNSELIDVWSDAVVVPPQISLVTAFNPDNPNAAPYFSVLAPTTGVLNVPAGKRLVLVLDINAHPQGVEHVVLHYEGAGVQFGQVLYDMEKDYNPLKEIITPTDAGKTFKVWAELRPTQVKSNVLEFHVGGDPDKPKADETSDKPKTADKPAKPDAKKTIPVKKGKH